MRAKPNAMSEHERRQFLDIFRIDLGTPVLQQRPHLREPAPADDGARGGAEIDAPLHQLGGRVAPPVGIFAVGSRGGHQSLDVAAEPVVKDSGNRAPVVVGELMRRGAELTVSDGRARASLVNVSFCPVRAIHDGSKKAHSMRMSVVVSLTPLCSPPMIPAMS